MCESCMYRSKLHMSWYYCDLFNLFNFLFVTPPLWLYLFLSALCCLPLPSLTVLTCASLFIHLSLLTPSPVHTYVSLCVLFQPSLAPAPSPPPLTLLSIFYTPHCVHLLIHIKPFFPLLSSLTFQMASTVFQPSAFSASSSSRRTCWAAVSPYASRTCPRSTSCHRCWVTSWRACQRCSRYLSRMFSFLTSSRTLMQRLVGSWMSASPRRCRVDSSSPQRL